MENKRKARIKGKNYRDYLKFRMTTGRERETKGENKRMTPRRGKILYR